MSMLREMMSCERLVRAQPVKYSSYRTYAKAFPGIMSSSDAMTKALGQNQGFPSTERGEGPNLSAHRMAKFKEGKVMQEMRLIEKKPSLMTETDEVSSFLASWLSRNQAACSTSLSDLLEQLSINHSAQIPQQLPYGNRGQKDASEAEIRSSILTIIHMIPAKSPHSNHKVITASGFAILDGSLIVSCAHSFYQIKSLLSSSDDGKAARTLAITDRGEIYGIKRVESHLAISDLVLLSLQPTTDTSSGHEDVVRLRPMPIDPYPAPISTPLSVYNLSTPSLSDASAFSPSKLTYNSSFHTSEVSFYADRAGQESKTGTYDTLSTMSFTSVPEPGSSGGPILHAETKAVVGVIRGSEMSYANRKMRGFGCPSEGIFEVFELPGAFVGRKS